MSKTTHCLRCHAKLDPRNQYILSKVYERKIVKPETICKKCFLEVIVKDYQEKEIFNLTLLRGISENDPILQECLSVKIFCKLLATGLKVSEKIAILENKIWFSGSPLREKINSDVFTVGDVFSYRDPLSHNDVVIQKQSVKTVIWINDTLGSMIEISVNNNGKQSLALSNITATLPNTLVLLDWVIVNHAAIAANLD